MLLPAHIKYLDQEVAPVIRQMQGPWVDLHGYASRLGDHTKNMVLSDKRINTVKQRISGYAKQVNFQIQKPYGETESGDSVDPNDGYWRAVEVYVYAHKPPPPKPVPPVVTAATQFEIRVVGGGSASIILQGDYYFFQIVDLVRRQTAFYQYTGLAVAIPGIPGLPGSLTKAGPPTKFRTTRPAELHQFNSKASLYQDPGATGGSASVGGTLRLMIEEMHDFDGFIFTVPRLIPIEGGSGIQSPGLGSIPVSGLLALISRIYPFTSY